MMTLQELHEHYKAVRARLNDPSKAYRKPEPIVIRAEPDIIVTDTPGRPADLFFINHANAILHRVAKKHGVTVADIRSPSRRPFLVRARQEAAYEIRTQRKLSLPQIAVLLGGRDHTTVLYGIKRHAELLARQAQEAE